MRIQRTVLVAAVAWLAVCLVPSSIAADRIRLTTLEWPPYTGKSLPLEGAVTRIVRLAFENAGKQIDVSYLPWKRAIASAKATDAVAYFPGYHCDHVEGFVASDVIGHGPLGFAEHVDAPITWASIADLVEQELKIGTVLGYANTAEFDERAGTGWIRVIPAPDDLTNLKKLLRRRVDAVVIDKLVLSYLGASDPELKAAGDKLRFNARPLEEKKLYVCFVDSSDGRALRDAFNAGLKRLDANDLLDEYFETQF